MHGFVGEVPLLVLTVRSSLLNECPRFQAGRAFRCLEQRPPPAGYSLRISRGVSRKVAGDIQALLVIICSFTFTTKRFARAADM